MTQQLTGNQNVQIANVQNSTIRSRAASVDTVRRMLYGRGDALDMVIDGAGVDLLSGLPFGEHERAELFATPDRAPGVPRPSEPLEVAAAHRSDDGKRSSLI